MSRVDKLYLSKQVGITIVLTFLDYFSFKFLSPIETLDIFTRFGSLNRHWMCRQIGEGRKGGLLNINLFDIHTNCLETVIFIIRLTFL